MKTILVIDVPDDYMGSVIDVELYSKGKTVHEKYVNKLKPMPKKLPEVSYDSGWWGWNKILDRIIEEQIKVKDFTKGWNACLEEIQK